MSAAIFLSASPLKDSNMQFPSHERRKNNFKILAFLLSFPVCVCVCGKSTRGILTSDLSRNWRDQITSWGMLLYFPSSRLCPLCLFPFPRGGEGGGGWHKEEIRIERDLTQSNISRSYSKKQHKCQLFYALAIWFQTKKKASPNCPEKKKKTFIFYFKNVFYFEGNRSVSTHFWATKKLRIICRKSRADPVYSSSFVVVPSKKPNSEKLAAAAH